MTIPEISQDETCWKCDFTEMLKKDDLYVISEQ